MINISKLYCGLSSESDRLRYEPTGSLGPVVVYNCTSRCNLRCRHCYSNSNSDAETGQLNTSQAKQLLSELAQVNCPAVLFSGGEPLLRDDLFQLLDHAKGLGLKSVISTNGTLIDSAAAEKLAQSGVGYVGISIDGQEKFHDKFRKVEGCFTAALQGIENCRKAGIKTGLRFTITSANASQIPVVFDIAASMQVRRICFYHLIRTGRAKQLNDQVLPPQQMRDAIETIIEKTNEFVARNLVDEVLTVGNHADGPFLLVKMIKESNPRRREAERLLRAGGNKTGQSIICVNWDGSVYPDQFRRSFSLGNVKDKGFVQIRKNSARPLSKKLLAGQRCSVCRWFELCGGNFSLIDAQSHNHRWINEPACYLTDDEIALQTVHTPVRVDPEK